MGSERPGISIENSSLGVHSGKDGSYIIQGLEDGNYTLRFSFIGYESQQHVVNLKGLEILDVILTFHFLVVRLMNNRVHYLL